MNANHKEMGTMYTIGKLAKEFGLSRTALLYYDERGLLAPSGRSTSNYRLYSEKDRKRLRNICRFRETGLSLKEIKSILDSSNPELVEILEVRLDTLNKEISQLRKQQHVIISILKNRKLLKETRYMGKESWVELLEIAGLDEQARHKWHLEFEKMSAEAHRDFLEQLGLSDAEITSIKRWTLEYEEQ
jgi:DNA-binding transcriptional MerR regulator